MATTGYQAGIPTNDVLLSYAPETVWGTKPAVAFNQIRVQSEGFTATKSRTRPSEINALGAVSQAVTQKMEAKGDFKFALSTALPFDLLAASIGGAAATAVSFAAKITVAATASGFTDSANGFVTAGIGAGDWIRVTGFTGGSAAQINGYYQVLTVAAGVLTTLPVPGATKVAGDSITMTGQSVMNGSVFQSFFFQKQLATALFLQYPGSVPIGGSISASVGNFFSGDMQFLSKSQDKATTDGSTGAQVAAGAGVVMDTVNGIGSVYRGAAVIAATVTKADLKWQMNSARMQYGMGSVAAAGYGKGLLEVSGTLEVYFKDFSLYDEFISETGSMVSFRAVDGTGAGYQFTIPNATIMNPNIVAGGPSQDIMASFQLEGNPSASSGIFAGASIQIDKLT